MIGDTVTVLTLVGEFVGKVVDYKDSYIELQDPRMIVTGEEGGMGFAQGIAMTGTPEPKLATFKDYVLVTETLTEVADAYREHTSGIVLPQTSGIIGA